MGAGLFSSISASGFPDSQIMVISRKGGMERWGRRGREGEGGEGKAQLVLYVALV